MKYILCLFILISCGSIKPSPKPPPPIPIPKPIPVPNPTPETPKPLPTPEPVVIDTIHVNQGSVSITDFGAVGNGSYDNADIIEAAANYVIKHPQPLIIPIGNFYISHSIHLQNNGHYFTIHVSGILPNKSSSDEYLSKITYGGRSGYAFGIQFGRSIEIENITVLGQYKFPYSVNNYNIGTLKFSDWNDASISDSRYKPYAAIVIDPDTNVSGTRGGTSDVTIKNCSIKQWMVGISLSPNGVTQNDEMINILDDEIDACRIAVSVCQDQSKTVNIKGLKVWSSVYTVLDGLNYGAGTGGGSVFCENWNIAGNVKQLFNITTSRFPFSANNIYAESLFRIGTISGYAGAILDNSLFDFISGPGLPAPDYVFTGGPVTFRGGAIRYYDNDFNHRLNFAQSQHDMVTFRDMTFNNYPITQGLYGIPTNHYPTPKFDNIIMYYNQSQKDTLIKFIPPYIYYNTSNWTASFTGAAGVQIGDYILASGNSSITYYDSPAHCATIQIGRIISIIGDVVTMDNVGLNAPWAGGSDVYYISRLK